MLDDFLILLRGVSTGLVEQAQVEKGSRWLEQFSVEYPLAHGLLISSVYREPKDVMKFLCMIWPDLHQYRKNEHVLTYIGKLQGELRKRNKP